MMDPERQPLLNPTDICEVRRRYALTHAEVLAAQETGWFKMRCVLIAIFWCIIAAMLSSVVVALASRDPCRQMPDVPPVHLSFAPLVRTLK